MSNSVKKNYIYNSLYTILNMLLPLITAPYLSRVIGTTGVGLYAYSFSIAQYCVLFAKLGLVNYGTRECAKIRTNKKKLSCIFINLFTMQCIATIIVTVIYLFYVELFSGTYKSIALIFTIWVVGSFLDIDWFWFGLEEFKKVTIRNVVVKLLTVICIFLFVKEKNDVPIYSFIMVMGYVIGYIAIWIGIKRKIYFSKIQLSEVRKHLVPCIVMLIPVLALNIYRSMNKVMLGSMVGMAETGIFDNGEKFIYWLSGLITSLGTVMLPKMSYLVEKNDVQQIHKYISLSIKFIVIMTSAMAFGLMAISNSLVYVMFGIAFQKSAIVLFLSAPTLIFMGWSNVIRTQYIIPHKKDDIYIKSTLFSAIINMLINIMLINRFLSVGAVIGTLIAEFFVPFYQYLRLRKEINYRKHLVAVIPYVLIGIGMVLILKFVEQLMGISIITLIVQTVLGGIIFVTCSVIYIYKCDKELLHFIMSTLKIRKG